MIKLLATILVRALVELALVLVLFAGVFAVVAFRTARRFATPAPDMLDKIAGPLSGVLSLAARHGGDGEYAEDDYDDEELAAEDWKEYVV